MEINITDYEQLIFKITNKFPKYYREDLIQELYIRIFELKDGFNPKKGTFITYLYKRLYYHCIDYINENNINQESLDEWVTDDEMDERRKSDSLESGTDEELRYEHRDYLEQMNKRYTKEELFIRTKYYELGLTGRMIIDLYSPLHGITSMTTIYKILNK